MLHSDIYTVNKLLRINQQIPTAHFWMNKLKIDFADYCSLCNLSTSDWLQEYKQLYKCANKASQFIKNIKNYKRDGLGFTLPIVYTNYVFPIEFVSLCPDITTDYKYKITVWIDIDLIKSKNLVSLLHIYVTNVYYTQKKVTIHSSFS